MGNVMIIFFMFVLVMGLMYVVYFIGIFCVLSEGELEGFDIYEYGILVYLEYVLVSGVVLVGMLMILVGGSFSLVYKFMDV